MLTDPYLVNACISRVRYSARLAQFFLYFSGPCRVSGAIFKSTAVTGVATLVSRITGLAREMIFAQAFGASAFMDAWLVAFKIPNFLRRLFAEGSFSQAFVPVISEYKYEALEGRGARARGFGRGHVRRGAVRHHAC